MTIHTVTATIAVRNDALIDILTTAIEGGCNYWADVENVVRNPEKDYIQADFMDNEDGEFHGTITLSSVALGMERILKPEFLVAKEVKKAVFEILADYDNASSWDAETADCIIQAALFDAITYS